MLLTGCPGTQLPPSGFNGLFCSMMMRKPAPLNKVIVPQSPLWLSAAGVCQTIWQIEGFFFVFVWFDFHSGEVAQKQ